VGPIKADLTRTDSKWQEWGFDDLLAALRDFTLRNPENAGSIGNAKNGRRPPRGEKQFQGTENPSVYTIILLTTDVVIVISESCE
jgi:hypothetical protein